MRTRLWWGRADPLGIGQSRQARLWLPASVKRVDGRNHARIFHPCGSAGVWPVDFRHGAGLCRAHSGRLADAAPHPESGAAAASARRLPAGAGRAESSAPETGTPRQPAAGAADAALRRQGPVLSRSRRGKAAFKPSRAPRRHATKAELPVAHRDAGQPFALASTLVPSGSTRYHSPPNPWTSWPVAWFGPLSLTK